MKRTFALTARTLVAVALIATTASCSSDEDKYASTFPRYAGLQTSPDTIHVGDTVTFTLVESVRGTNIGSPNYTWSVGEFWENAKIQDNTPRLYSESGHPTMKVVATAAGEHEITFTARWSVNGQAQPAPAPYIVDQLSVISTASTLNYFVIAKKKIKVLR